MGTFLTDTQRAALRDFVRTTSNPQIVAARVAGATFDLMNLLNAPSVPTQSGWRFIPRADVIANLHPAEVDNLYTTSKGPALDFLIIHSGGLDCTTSDGPKAITDILAQSPAPASRAAMLAIATDAVSVAQAQLGGASATSQTPPTAITALVRNFTGNITQQDCQGFLAP